MFCPKCNTENRDSATFCDNCGTKFKKEDENALAETEESSRPFLIKIAVMAIIIAVILLLFFIFNNGQNSKSTKSGITTIPQTTTTVTFGATNGIAFISDLYYNSNSTLRGNIATTGNVVIKNGVVLDTDGYSIIAGGTFNNSGTVNAGNPGDSASQGSVGTSYKYSYGGSGGSGSGGNSGKGGSGATPSNPSLSNAQILAWYNSGLMAYLTGAGGGGACKLNGSAGNGGSTIAPGGNLSFQTGHIPCEDTGGTPGASGSYGVYIQANKIIAGVINANGLQASPGAADGGGGGGGGVIILAYGAGGFVSGTYDVNGGPAQQDSGAGGAGQVWIYPYGSMPPITP